MKNLILHGDAGIMLEQNVKDKSIAMCYTCPTPPFKFDKYKENVVGSEGSIDDYMYSLMEIFMFVHKKLKDNGSLFVQLGDYRDPETGCFRLLPEIFLMNMSNSWFLKSRIIWDRVDENLLQVDKTGYKRDFEFIYHFIKKPKAHQFITKNNKHWTRSIWRYPCKEINDGSFASGYPEELIYKAMIPTTNEGDIVLDIFAGTGTLADVAIKLKRKFILIDIDFNMCELLNIKFAKYV